MTPLSRPVRRGPNYVVIAGDASGGQVRVVVDAFDGAIVRVRPVVAMQPYRRSYGAVVGDPYAPRPRVAIAPPHEIKDPPPVVYGADPYGPRARVDGGPAPLPPRSVPNARIATAPNAAMPHTVTPSATAAPHALAAQPPRTPLPRPRPTVASNETTGTTPSAPPAVQPVGEGSWPVPAKPAASEPKSGGDETFGRAQDGAGRSAGLIEQSGSRATRPQCRKMKAPRKPGRSRQSIADRPIADRRGPRLRQPPWSRPPGACRCRSQSGAASWPRESRV